MLREVMRGEKRRHVGPSLTARVCKICRYFMRSFDNRMFDSASLKPATRVPSPGILIAMMPAAMNRVNVTVHINLTDVEQARLSVLAKR